MNAHDEALKAGIQISLRSIFLQDDESQVFSAGWDNYGAHCMYIQAVVLGYLQL